MPGPAVTIIMPTFNRCGIISKSIISILGQSFKDFELLIIDDGSTDATKDKALSFRDKRIIYIKRPHSGLAAARNYGLKIAKGRYVAYCDDDSVYYKGHFKRSVEFLKKNPAFGMVYSGFINSLNNIGAVEKRIGFNKRRLEAYNYIAVFTALHRKECIKKVGLFDGKATPREDWDFWLRFSDYYKVGYLPYLAGKHVYYPGAISLTQKTNQGLRRESVIRKRIYRARKKNELLSYINGSSIGVIAYLIRYGNIRYASGLSRIFYKTIANYQSYACLGIAALAKGKAREANRLFKESLRRLRRDWRNQDNWYIENALRVKIQLARSYCLLKKTAPAITLYRGILKIAPKNTEARIELARYRLKNRDCKKTLGLVGDIEFNADAYNLKGCCYFLKGNYRRAAEEFKKAIMIDPRVGLYRKNLNKASPLL